MCISHHEAAKLFLKVKQLICSKSHKDNNTRRAFRIVRFVNTKKRNRVFGSSCVAHLHIAHACEQIEEMLKIIMMMT